MTKVEVKWVDSCITEGWTNSVCEIGQMVSIGFLVKKTKDTVVLAQSIDTVQSHARWCNQIAIPRKAITGYRRMK